MSDRSPLPLSHRPTLCVTHALHDDEGSVILRQVADSFFHVSNRHGEGTRDINLRIVDLETIHERFLDSCDDWVARAPPSWKRDRFLLDNTPVAVTMRYGQNQPILVRNCVAPERQSWKRDHRYDHIKHFTFSIASHVRRVPTLPSTTVGVDRAMTPCFHSFLEVEEWEDLPTLQVAANNPIAYDSHDPSTRRRVDLLRYPLENPFGDVLPTYDRDGFRVIRQKILSHRSTGTLMDLSLAHTLFQTDGDDFGHVRNDVKYTVYPLAFTRNLGNVQANGVITSFGRRMNMLDAKLQGIAGDEGGGGRRGGRGREPRARDRSGEPGLYSDDDDNDDENSDDNDNEANMDVDTPEREPPPPPPLLHAICSQIYNAISHRVRDAAKFHEVQLGLVTTSLAGTTASSLPSKNRWQRNLDRCRGDLPHVRCAQKVAGPGQPQCMRFENTYRLDVQHLPERKRSGE